MKAAASPDATEGCVLKSLYERVAERCNSGGLPIGAGAVAEVARFLAQERRAAKGRG